MHSTGWANALAGASPSKACPSLATAPLYWWRGSALHVPATILIHGRDAKRGDQLAPVWEAELRRLDQIFSLCRPASAICLLNRDGGLRNPPPEMVELLSICANIHPLTDGFFDPSVQPVWNLYAHHFRRSPGSARGPDLDAQSRVRERIGFERVVVEAGRVELLGPGMALTLN
ncbi:MAG: FAD:protein FMN transferase, partial [Chromatiales bacterium]|nr:FAD:protein FMN transferase [Chromatiales bacterium]